jgi:hypothetical protein
MNTTKTLNALNATYGPSARNFCITVCARQIAFLMESRGFSRKASTTENPSGEAVAFDESLSVGLPGFDGQDTKPAAYSNELAAEAYSCCMLLASDALRVPLEYGRIPKPESLSRYFSNPGEWLSRKVQYHKPRLEREAAENGAIFGATAEGIAKNTAAKVQEFTDWATGIAKQQAAAIKLYSKTHSKDDAEDLATTVIESMLALGVDPDTETKGAASALLRIRKEAFERGEKVTMPQPGMLSLFHDLGVSIK